MCQSLTAKGQARHEMGCINCYMALAFCNNCSWCLVWFMFLFFFVLFWCVLLMPLFDLTYDLPGLKLADLPVRFSSRLPFCHHQHFENPLSFNFFSAIPWPAVLAGFLQPPVCLSGLVGNPSVFLRGFKNLYLFLAYPSHPELHACFSVLSALPDVCLPYRRRDIESITGDTHDFTPSIRKPCVNNGSDRDTCRLHMIILRMTHWQPDFRFMLYCC